METLYRALSLTDDLPSDWLVRIARLVREYGQDVRVEGRGPGSLEPDETAGLDYRVVDGEAIRDRATWLWDLYHGESWVRVVSEAMGERVKPSAHVKSSINVNFLRGVGGRYELHLDGQPYSAVLQCDNLDAATGGRLIVRDPDDGTEHAIDPRPGLCPVFDGSKIPHAVEALRFAHLTRTSIPMVYVPAWVEERPEGLDDYLYAKS